MSRNRWLTPLDRAEVRSVVDEGSRDASESLVDASVRSRPQEDRSAVLECVWPSDEISSHANGLTCEFHYGR